MMRSKKDIHRRLIYNFRDSSDKAIQTLEKLYQKWII